MMQLASTSITFKKVSPQNEDLPPLGRYLLNDNFVQRSARSQSGKQKSATLIKQQKVKQKSSYLLRQLKKKSAEAEKGCQKSVPKKSAEQKVLKSGLLEKSPKLQNSKNVRR